MKKNILTTIILFPGLVCVLYIPNFYTGYISIFISVLLALIVMGTKQRFWYGPVYLFINFTVLCVIIPIIAAPNMWRTHFNIDNIDNAGLFWDISLTINFSAIYFFTYFIIKLFCYCKNKIFNKESSQEEL